jgi:hypothetical protein
VSQDRVRGRSQGPRTRLGTFDAVIDSRLELIISLRLL